jgi:hypothetical protein
VTLPDEPLAGLCILLVEDDPINQMMLEVNLEDDGARLVIVGDGATAVERIIADGPGCLRCRADGHPDAGDGRFTRPRGGYSNWRPSCRSSVRPRTLSTKIGTSAWRAGWPAILPNPLSLGLWLRSSWRLLPTSEGR